MERKQRMALLGIPALMGFGIVGVAQASPQGGLIPFKDGDVAKASEVNDNFMFVDAKAEKGVLAFDELNGNPASTEPGLREKVADLKTRLDQLQPDVEDLADRTVGLENRSTALEQAVSDLDLRTDDLEGRARSLELRATSLEGRASLLESRATTLESNVRELQKAVNGIFFVLTAHDVRIRDLETAVDALEGEFVVLRNRVSIAENDIRALRTDLTRLGERVTSLEGSVTGLRNDVTGLQGSVGNLRSGITVANGFVGIGSSVPKSHLELQGTMNRPLRGNFKIVDDMVFGVGTDFANELRVGDAIRFEPVPVGRSVAVVISIDPSADPQELRIDPPLGSFAGLRAFSDSDLFRTHNGAGVSKSVVDKTGRVGIGGEAFRFARANITALPDDKHALRLRGPYVPDVGINFGVPVSDGIPLIEAFGGRGLRIATERSTAISIKDNGDVNFPGMISKGGGSFRIDHPLDPDNKYLAHSFVESPDMMNVYNGNIVLGPEGDAWVELPDWFEALNEGFRYQLTPIGGPGPGLFVAEEVQGNRFKISGGSAGLKVSWQVTGIRHDALARAHRIEVEQEKPVAERGTRLYPIPAAADPK
jgi:predicted  nucleic acid-binding Zn-ribbon protein